MGCEKHPQPAGKLTYPGPVFVQRGSTTALGLIEVLNMLGIPANEKSGMDNVSDIRI
jgi:hypothetical protein